MLTNTKTSFEVVYLESYTKASFERSISSEVLWCIERAKVAWFARCQALALYGSLSLVDREALLQSFKTDPRRKMNRWCWNCRDDQNVFPKMNRSSQKGFGFEHISSWGRRSRVYPHFQPCKLRSLFGGLSGGSVFMQYGCAL